MAELDVVREDITARARRFNRSKVKVRSLGGKSLNGALENEQA
jgi:hypothetical protein